MYRPLLIVTTVLLSALSLRAEDGHTRLLRSPLQLAVEGGQWGSMPY